MININACNGPRGWDGNANACTVQIILRVYHSPAEVLLGFDIDPVCVGYDGQHLWALPRAMRALETGVTICNPLHAWPVQPSYELRLAKYAARGFHTAVPGIDLSGLDWNSTARHKLTDLRGAARLLHVHLTLTIPEARRAGSSFSMNCLGHTTYHRCLDWEGTLRRTFGDPIALVSIAEDRESTDPTGLGHPAQPPSQEQGWRRRWSRGGWVSGASTVLNALPYDADKARMLVQDPSSHKHDEQWP